MVLNGGHVHWARDAAELNDIVLGICRRVEASRVETMIPVAHDTTLGPGTPLLSMNVGTCGLNRCLRPKTTQKEANRTRPARCSHG